MQPDRFAAAQTWLGNARLDLELAREIAERYASRSCLHAQQCAELALKALLIALADDRPRSHIGEVLMRELLALGCDVPNDVLIAANRLDLFYMGSRYPDALGGADPSKVLQISDAGRAIEQAELVFSFTQQSLVAIGAAETPSQ